MDAALLRFFMQALPDVDCGNMENLGDRPQLGARTFRMGPARDGLWRYKPDSWYRVCDHRDCFASLAMTPQMAVIARSGATKQSRCEARWRESSVWFRPSAPTVARRSLSLYAPKLKFARPEATPVRPRCSRHRSSGN